MTARPTPLGDAIRGEAKVSVGPRVGRRLEALADKVDALANAAAAVAHDFKFADYDGSSPDRSWCPYNRRGLPGADPRGICSFGCREEPSCHTDGPWPLSELLEACEELGLLDQEVEP
jgi:hypothetical protein